MTTKTRDNLTNNYTACNTFAELRAAGLASYSPTFARRLADQFDQAMQCEGCEVRVWFGL